MSEERQIGGSIIRVGRQSRDKAGQQRCVGPSHRYENLVGPICFWCCSTQYIDVFIRGDELQAGLFFFFQISFLGVLRAGEMLS